MAVIIAFPSAATANRGCAGFETLLTERKAEFVALYPAQKEQEAVAVP